MPRVEIRAPLGQTIRQPVIRPGHAALCRCHRLFRMTLKQGDGGARGEGWPCSRYGSSSFTGPRTAQRDGLPNCTPSSALTPSRLCWEGGNSERELALEYQLHI